MSASEKRREQQRASAARHRAETNAKAAVYREAHRAELREKGNARNAANRGKKNLESAAYYAAHKEEYKVRNARRRALVRNAEGSHTAADVKAIYEKQEGNCYWCGKHVGKEYHVDHFMPLSKGGSNCPENLVISCPSCNLRKHAKLPDEWLNERGGGKN